jgi:hypothetical protein
MAVTLAVAVVSAPAHARVPASDPWVAFSALASPASAAPLANRPQCRSAQEIEQASRQQSAGRLPVCIAPGLELARGRAQPAGRTGITSMLLGLSSFLGMMLAPMSAYAADRDLQPVSP